LMADSAHIHDLWPSSFWPGFWYYLTNPFSPINIHGPQLSKINVYFSTFWLPSNLELQIFGFFSIGKRSFHYQDYEQ
jgi:hypothetical protein